MIKVYTKCRLSLFLLISDKQMQVRRWLLHVIQSYKFAKKCFMIKVFTTILLSLFFFCSYAQTQTDMDQTESNELTKADKKLNAVYQKIISDYRKDAVFIKNLKASQRLWIQFRDVELKMKYPDRPAGYYGSVQPICQSVYLAQLTNDRIKDLQVWIDGIPEGDACAGSVKKQ